MRTLAVLLGLSLMQPAAFAQADTTASPARNATSLHLGVNNDEGAYAKIVQGSDTTKNGKQPTIIETKRKRITINVEDKEWGSVTDSLEDRLKEIRTERRDLFTYWAGIDVGVNAFMGADGDTDLDAAADFMQVDHRRSRFISINFIEQKIEFGTHHVGLLTGLGLEFANYHLKNNNLLAYNADSVFALPVESPEFRKNKLRQMGFRVPLMLEFNTKRAKLPTPEELAAKAFKGFSQKRNVHLAAGVVGSWYFDTMYKQKFSDNGNTRKERDKGDYLLRPYRLAASARIGYGSLNLFAEYSLTPLFNDDKGPELTPLTVGLTLIGFN
ncbi:MAG: hypothetical protein IPO05_03305 [Flavobacteriales bacterium]|nr:hypothetical protein [Flavobacteriales bacterium]